LTRFLLRDLLDGGQLRLIEAAGTVEDARMRVDELLKMLPGQYVIYDDTRERISISAGVHNPLACDQVFQLASFLRR